MPTPRKRGRPATGAQHVGEAHLYLTAEDKRVLLALKARLGLGVSGILRVALRDLAKKEGLE